jgi:hypothetical protein
MRKAGAVTEEHDLLVAALTDYAAAERDWWEAVVAIDESRLIEIAERLDQAPDGPDSVKTRASLAEFIRCRDYVGSGSLRRARAADRSLGLRR